MSPRKSSAWGASVIDEGDFCSLSQKVPILLGLLLMQCCLAVVSEGDVSQATGLLLLDKMTPWMTEKHH